MEALLILTCERLNVMTSARRDWSRRAISIVDRHDHSIDRHDHTINAKPPERLQQHPLLFTTNHTDRTFFVWRLNSVRPPHPGHSTFCCDRKSDVACAQSFALRQQATIEIMRRHLSYYSLLALHIQWCYSSRTSRSWRITQSMQHHRIGSNFWTVLPD